MMIKNRRTYEALTKKLAKSADRWREAKGLSKLELARRLNIEVQDVRKMLNAKHSMSAGRMTQLCFALEITPNDLFGWHQPIKWSKKNEDAS